MPPPPTQATCRSLKGSASGQEDGEIKQKQGVGGGGGGRGTLIETQRLTPWRCGVDQQTVCEWSVGQKCFTAGPEDLWQSKSFREPLECSFGGLGRSAISGKWATPLSHSKCPDNCTLPPPLCAAEPRQAASSANERETRLSVPM